MRTPRLWLSLLMIVACGGNSDTASNEPETANESGSEQPASESQVSAGESVNPNPTVEPLGEDASEAAHEAEYARGQVHRLELQLQAHLDREDIECEEASATKQEICDLAQRICEMDQSDSDVAARCNAVQADCDEAGSAVGDRCA